MRVFNRLHTTVVVPFVALFFALSALSALVVFHFQSRFLESRLSDRADRLAEVLSRSEFVLNPAYMERLREVIEADVAVVDLDKRAVVSTCGTDLPTSVEKYPGLDGFFREAGEKEISGGREVFSSDGRRFLMACRPLGFAQSREERRLLCVISCSEDAGAVKSKTLRALVAINVAGVAFATAIGLAIAKFAGKPIEKLISLTEEISEGGFGKKVSISHIREFEKLADAVNTMSEKLGEYESRAARANRLTVAGKISSALAHEIRNPLSSMKMNAQLMRDRMGSEKDKAMAVSLIEEIDRIDRIVNDLIGISKPSELARSVESINSVLEETLAVLEMKLRHRNIVLEKMFDSSNPLVNIDKGKIKQVVMNLTINAMESMPGGGKVRVRSKFREDLSEVEILVEDEGCGIGGLSMEEMSAPFFTTKEQGLGLGLSTSREIAELHSGRLTVEKRPEGGARAVLRLPAML